MTPDQLGVMIPIIALCIPIIAIWTKHRRTIVEMQLKASTQQSAESAAQYAQHNRDLEERVRILEAIVTDKGFDTAAQIENLRRESAALESGRQ